MGDVGTADGTDIPVSACLTRERRWHYLWRLRNQVRKFVDKSPALLALCEGESTPDRDTHARLVHSSLSALFTALERVASRVAPTGRERSGVFENSEESCATGATRNNPKSRKSNSK